MAVRAMVAVKDLALGGFLNPFFVPSVGIAVRHFGDECVKADSPMCAHPEDFELWHLGDFDESGAFNIFAQPVRLSRGVDYKESRNAS